MTPSTMSTVRKLGANALFGLALAFSSLTASAQTAENKAAAEALFDEGRSLMNKGDLAGACRKFEQSDQLDTAPGTLLNLADCYERLGRVASAWATYRRAAPLARERGQNEREKFARSRASELEPKLPRLKVVVPDQSRFDGLTIESDGRELAPALWGQALPMDPGTVKVVASAQGRQSWSGQVELKLGAAAELIVPLLTVRVNQGAPTAAPSATGKPPSVQPVTPAITPAPDQTPAPAEPGKTQRMAAYSLGGVAGVALVVTGILAAMARSKYDASRADRHCLEDDPNACDPTGKSLRDDALRYGNWATVSTVVAAVSAGGALALYFTAPKQRVGFVGGVDGRGATLALKGQW